MSTTVVELDTTARRYDGQVYARLPADLDERLREYAGRYGVSASAVIRVALERFLAQEYRRENPMSALVEDLNIIAALPTRGA